MRFAQGVPPWQHPNPRGLTTFEPMNASYELIDFGGGRKLERFGHWILDRPSPAAIGVPVHNAETWHLANAIFRGQIGNRGKWLSRNRPMEEEWEVEFPPIRFGIRLTPFGHVGIFPEQAKNWNWIRRQVNQSRQPLRVLNLFGYTGGSTLAAAVAGASVVHVDAAKTTIAWARRNAQRAGLANAPIRWITEDAAKFVTREIKRGNQYDAVILDPPSYGRGPKGETFKLTEDLMPLLVGCGELTRASRRFLLLTCHSPGFGPADLEACLADAVFGACSAGAAASPLDLKSRDGRLLNAGCNARWPG